MSIRRALAVGVSVLAVGAAVPADAESGLEPRVLVGTPWAKDDTVGDASRPQGDVRKVVIENGRQRVTFTFRMVAAPIWDTFATSRETVMRFRLDWRGTTAAHERQVSVSWSEGAWRIVTRNETGGPPCLRDGGVRPLGNHRYQFSVPVAQCLGGPHVLRVASTFRDDRDDSAAGDIRLDRVPNSGGYGPFIRLPS